MNLNDPTPFRMPDSWYDPPEVREWTCPDCGELITDEVCECGTILDEDEGPDPDDLRDLRLDREWEERSGQES